MTVIATEIYSRCSGYFRPVSNWNPGKKAEFADRKALVFDQEKALTPVKLE